jgi:hypothetical protein
MLNETPIEENPKHNDIKRGGTLSLQDKPTQLTFTKPYKQKGCSCEASILFIRYKRIQPPLILHQMFSRNPNSTFFIFITESIK